MLYPDYEDEEFNTKIALKKEFNEHKYTTVVSKNIEELEAYSDKLCNAEFELAPHQMFIRNFLSFQTPYNSILLYHGLGTGKTCSAISIAEEMRDYNKQINSRSKIIFVASPNVQDNFKLQLFNENKLKNNKGLWYSDGCVGNKLLNEVNPANSKNLDKENIIKMVNKIIKNNYSFYGYTKFANIISSIYNSSDNVSLNVEKLRQVFDNNLVIIDEAHNVRSTMTDSGGKSAVDMLDILVENTKTMRLCLLSGTPMYNDNTEIVWLLNLLNKNDNREIIKRIEVFDRNGNFIVDDDGNEIGKEKLITHMRGYVSFIRGDNPYMFPFKIYPSMFANLENKLNRYPDYSFNNNKLESKINYIDLYINNLNEYQESGYDLILQSILKKKDINFEKIDSFGYTELEDPILGLNIIYPNDIIDDHIKPTTLPKPKTKSKTPTKGGNKTPNISDFREYKTGEEHISFHSGGKPPYNELSNLSQIKEGVEINGLRFISTEHAYQAQKFIPEDRIRFSMDGDLGNINGFNLIYSEKDAEKKRNFWMKKYNIGIIAKTAASNANIKKLKLREDPSFDVKQNIPLWLNILKEKFKIDYFRDMLLSTDNKYLLEFSKSAKRDSEAGKEPFYNGLIDKNVLYGINMMGKLLMYIRDELKNPRIKDKSKSESEMTEEPDVEETDFDIKQQSNDSKTYDEGYDDGYKLYDEIYDNGYKDAEYKKQEQGPSKLIKNPNNSYDNGFNDALNEIYSEGYAEGIVDNKAKKRDLKSVNYKLFVGSVGLNSIMDYTDTKNPPSKTNFKYKPEILTKYGKIFSRENIGKYSSKIESVCNNIENSEGIILIYSEYIDGGIIPTALALEEMGYRRYGKVPSLFKDHDSPNIGSYVIISGNKNISPNNISDIKALTNNDNLNGERIKICIISRAGAEGLDLVAIRQIHILEPWYNMNRIEQIIGRGVRTCSHSNLPLVNRNVQIFLHGSRSKISNNEMLDLYIYRKAEEKAIKIGEVTRILKANSIDSILNIEQMNFDEDIMNINVNQTLSNGKNIMYKVGDKPLTSMCDYMEKCQYIDDTTKEKYNQILYSKDIDKSTYNESFIKTNLEIIIKKIKFLFKHRYFYNRNDLFSNVRKMKYYSDEQIYMGISALIEDNSEIIKDKFGRDGTLVNIDDYYFFKPVEIDNVNTSDVRIPIHNKIDELKINLTKKPEKKEKDVSKSDNEQNKYINLIKELISKILSTEHIVDLKSIDTQSNYAWYQYFAIIKTVLIKNKINEEIINIILYNHIFEELILEDILLLLKFIGKINTEDLVDNKISIYVKTIEDNIENYFSKYIIDYNSVKYILLYNDANKTEYQLYEHVNNEEWVPLNNDIFAKYLAVDSFKQQLYTKYKIISSTSNLNNVYGSLKKISTTDSKNSFKIYDINVSSRGQNCTKKTVSKSRETFKLIPASSKFITKELNNQYGICFLTEILLRYYDIINKDKKIWFLSNVEHSLNLPQITKLKK